MKIATVLSLSAVFALTSLVAAVGCSAPAADGKDDKGAQSRGDGDEGKDPPAKAAPASTTNKTTPPASTGTTAAPEDGACLACVGPTTKAGLNVKCADACDAQDDACFEKCGVDNCGADGAACKADFARCEDKCSGPAPTAEELAAFDTCMAENPKTKKYNECAKSTCKEGAPKSCGDTCWTNAGCDGDAACEQQEAKCYGDAE